jgi:Asp-tRNA(Asn)/Glu-tRNA(Gln) amidotransferase A subunit family amidase
MDLTQPESLTATEAARAIAAGSISSERLVEACLARIRAVEPTVQAWQFLDEAHALAQGRARDRERAEGCPMGPLHGVPVGIKDIIDTADMPTENGTVLHAGRQPARDATVIAMLRAAGAVILGKTVTTECATYTPGKTRNPHDPSRTPGGSSSGSAAAVAAGMVPLAIGTQTNASILRPAAFCGVYGFKPSHGLIPRQGILKLSRALDCVGVFARDLDDIALLAEQLTGYDPADPDTRPRARIPFMQTMNREPPPTPRLAFVKTPIWDRADSSTHKAFDDLTAVLSARCETCTLPAAMAEAWAWHKTIMEAEMAANLDREWETGRDRLSTSLREQLARGREVRALDYQKALASVPRLRDDFDALFANFDAVLTPVTAGTAPPIETTGDPSFCTLWTLLGLPSVSLPLMAGHDGLPLGVQLVGRRAGDAPLLRTARWLVDQVQAP